MTAGAALEAAGRNRAAAVKEVEGTGGKLANPDFLGRAPQPVVDKIRERLARAEAERRYAVNQTDRSRLNDRARRQRDWATKGTKAEKNPSDNDRAARGFRMNRTEKLASKARQTERAIERLQVVDKPWEPWEPWLPWLP